MASNWTICGVCDFRNINKTSVVWCSECDEGLCDDCREHHGASKSTRNHDTISITEYQKLPTNVLEITQTCQKHKEHYQTFCKKHDCPCCRRCVIETHNDCKDLKALDDIVQNVKSSSTFLEVEQMMIQMLKNLRRIRDDRTENVKCLQDQRVKIERDIKLTRTMINDHLDKVQEKIIKELYANEENESKRITQLLAKIEDIEKGISDLQVNQNDIRQHASELQTFLALKHIEKEVLDEEECIQFVLKSEEMKMKTMVLELSKEVQNICRADSFGSVIVESNSSKINISGNNHKQAQTMVPVLISKGIDDIKLSNKMKIELQKGVYIRGCAILPNGQMIFSDCDKHSVVSYNSNGTYDLKIALNTEACDIVYIEKENIIAVTSGNSAKVIHIIDPKSREMKRSIKTSAYAYGIALNKNTIVYCTQQGNGIMEIQLNDETEKRIASTNVPSYSYVAVYSDNVYYTNRDDNSVTCCDFEGNIKWTFKDTTNLKYPQGISTDSNGNLYVAGRNSKSVVVISSDGKHCRQILSASDGLNSPRALHFETKSNKLLVANETKIAFIFDVS